MNWLEPLLLRYQAAMTRSGPDHSALADRYETLRLAAGLARKLRDNDISTTAQTSPIQIVVLGPTQAGKSSVVNRLVDLNVAGVSALAGHTVHAQAFIPVDIDNSALTASLASQLHPLQITERNALSREELGSWSAQSINPGANALAPDAVVWDTPDFDSVDAGRYREAVLAPAALADVIVLVLSKDKYGDLSVWKRIDALAQLGTPLVFILNKLDDASRGTVSAAFATRWSERTGQPQPDTVLLPWINTGGAWPRESSSDLHTAIDKARRRSMDTQARARELDSFVKQQTESWLFPLQEAASIRQRWELAVRDIKEQAMASYTARYLDDTARFDAVQRTVAELLTLLELPGLARTLAHTRNVVTWPARTLLGIGRKRFQRDGPTPLDRELDVLDGILKDAIHTARECARDAEETGDPAGTWRAIDRRLAAESDTLQGRWQQQAESLREAFQPRIEASARDLHNRLSEQPALLNTLRATRATTDAAGVALAVKSGGLAPADLILAPAMLSITTLLTESALGRYLDSIANRLKNELAELVRDRLVESVLGDTLLSIEQQLAEDGLLGRDMDPQLARVLSSQHASSDIA